MPEFCPSCGGTIDPNSPFCPTCGRQVPERAASTAPQYRQQGPVYAPQPVYQAIPQNANVAPVLSLGNYLGMMLLAAIPTVGFILLLVWAFSSGENPNKKNYARAALLVNVIITALIFYAVMIALGAGLSMLDA